MARKAMDVCLRELKERDKLGDSYVFLNLSLRWGVTARLQPQESSPTLTKLASWNNRDKEQKKANTLLSEVFTAMAVVVS